jgi:hypothetical protein
MRQSFAAALATGLLVTSAVAQEPLALRDMGSFHVGGRKVEVTGQPVKEIVRVPGGPTSKLDLIMSNICTRSTSWCRTAKASGRS